MKLFELLFVDGFAMLGACCIIGYLLNIRKPDKLLHIRWLMATFTCAAVCLVSVLSTQMGEYDGHGVHPFDPLKSELAFYFFIVILSLIGMAINYANTVKLIRQMESKDTKITSWHLTKKEKQTLALGVGLLFLTIICPIPYEVGGIAIAMIAVILSGRKVVLRPLAIVG